MTPKRPRDPNQLAKSIIDIATGQQPSPVDDGDDLVGPENDPQPQSDAKSSKDRKKAK
jgi:hypothetical protein